MKEKPGSASSPARNDNGDGGQSRVDSRVEPAIHAQPASAATNGLLNTLHEPAVIINDQMQVVSVNVPFEELISQSAETIIGRHLLKAAPVLDVPGFQDLLRRLAAGEIDSCEDKLRADELGDAGLFSVKALRLAKEVMGGKLLITVTKFQTGARPLVPHKAALHAQSFSRPLALTSHDLRQPLQTLSLLQGLMVVNTKDPKLQEWIARIGDALSALTGTLDALTCMSELERNAIEPDFASHEMNSVLDRLRPMLGYYAEARGLDWYIASSHAVVRSDLRLLEQLLRALLLHAMKLLRNGTVLIGCRPWQGKLRVEIWIAGNGISDHQQQTILDEFQKDLGHSDDGIVASFVKPLADLLGISLWARSHPGQGMAIAAELPTPGDTVALVKRDETDDNASGSSIESVILVVSDDTSIRDMLEVLIRTFGYATVPASSLGDDASSVRKDVGRIDLIVADLSTYSNDAYLRVLYDLRSKLEADPPAIVFTSEGAIKSMQTTKSGPIVYLPRPVDAEELKLNIAQVIERQARTPELRQDQRQGAYASSPQTIYVVEDDDVLRETLQGILKDRSAKLFATCEEFLSEYSPSLSGCLLVDNVMTGMRGVELLERLAAEGSRIPAIMITGHADIPTAVRAMKAGAIDFIQKPVTYDVLLAAIERALHIGHREPERDSTKSLLKTQMAALTVRERQVMRLVVHGFSNKAIARRLGISRRTVENHRASVMKKTGATSLPDLTRMVLELDVLEGEENRQW